MQKDDLARWFAAVRDVLETAYLAQTEPWLQSGKSGPEEYWIAARRPVADCIERDGSFLDIGCANGYLMECVVKWTAERGIKVTPYGLDISARLVELARRRMPQYADNLFVGNSWDRVSPRRFDYVRTELVYVPPELQREYVRRLLDRLVNDGGRLLVAEYRSRRQSPGATWIEQKLVGADGATVTVAQPSPVDEALRGWGFNVARVVSGFWEGKEVTRVAVVERV